jgi:hypothetical protein
MATTYNSFAVSAFDKFIPYTPPEPRAVGKPALKESLVHSGEWTDIDELIRNLAEEGDHHLDTLGTTPPLNLFDPGLSWFNSASLALFLTKATRQPS